MTQFNAKEKQAKAIYANHTLFDRTPTRLILQKEEGDSSYWLCLCAAHGQMSVFGDTDPFVFANYNDPDGDYIKAMVNWMSGEHHQTLDEYVIEKATIGGNKESLYTFSDEQFDKDVKSTLESINEHHGYHEEERLMYAKLKDDIDFHYSNDEAHGNAINLNVFHDWLGDKGIEDCWESMPDNFGQEICMGLYFAHAAISRVNDLLACRDGVI